MTPFTRFFLSALLFLSLLSSTKAAEVYQVEAAKKESDLKANTSQKTS